MSHSALASQLLLQLGCILIACRAIGWLTGRVKQPQVVAEMIAGFLMGPSFFGLMAPDLHARLFPAQSLPPLYVISQIGLTLYMFCVGLDLRVDVVAASRRAALSIAATGLVVPFTLGGILAVVLYQHGGLFADGINVYQSVLFLGTAMAVTAFPVLARIISERGVTHTKVGALALAAASLDDAGAWVLLSIVLGSTGPSLNVALLAIGGAIAYAVTVFFGVRPRLARLAASVEHDGRLPASVLGTILLMMVFGAWFTDITGTHAVFGAFLLGAALPRGLLADELQRTVEPLVKALLLPVFFVYAGLNTRLALVSSPVMIGLAVLVLATACVGKGVGCWAGARLAGATPREALGVATLMNARGMVELIILNIGLERGLITPTLMAMLVMMAIITTVMTGPMFSAVFQKETPVPVPAWPGADRLRP